MDAAVPTAKPRASALLLEHCFALDDRRRPTARARLELALGSELARRLVLALSQ